MGDNFQGDRGARPLSERDILEAIALGRPLAGVLDDICLLAEWRLGPDALCCIMIAAGVNLGVSAAPSLDPDFLRRIDGLPMGPSSISAGMAAYYGETDAVADIEKAANWGEYRDFALHAGLHACCAIPLFSTERRLLGVFCVYYRHVRHIGADEQSGIGREARLAAIAVERHQELEQLRRAADVFDSTDEGIVITDVNNNVIAINKAFTLITGYTPAEVLGRNPRLVSSGWNSRDFYHNMWASIQETGHWQGEIRNRRKSGELYWEWLVINAVRNEKGETTHHIGIFSDISERKAADERIHYLAHYDALTDLPNRLLLRDRLRQAIAGAQRHGEKVAVLFLDLDRFKHINDSLGHYTGDMLLKEVAGRLKNCTRRSDTVSRLGGDEFVIISGRVSALERITDLAQRVLDAFVAPFEIQENELHISPSIGISIFPDDGDDFDDLVKNADAAMYHAKSSGRNNFQFFKPELNQHVSELLAMENDLRRALRNQEFVLYYQPQVSLATGAIVGAEALIRWNHPEQGMVAPGRFIPVAEETRLIIPMGEWVLREACRQNVAWREAGLPVVPIAVNLSALQFSQKGLLKLIEDALAESGLDPALLELEVTESAIMHDAKLVIAILEDIKAMGVQLSIDDFGTGYSSLSYLKRFPIDKLKVDQSFIRDLTVDANDAAIATAIISMAKSLGLKVIAEGVETAAQMELLRSWNCDEMQGYFFSRPEPAGSLADMLRAGRRLEFNAGAGISIS